MHTEKSQRYAHTHARTHTLMCRVSKGNHPESELKESTSLLIESLSLAFSLSACLSPPKMLKSLHVNPSPVFNLQSHPHFVSHILYPSLSLHMKRIGDDTTVTDLIEISVR